MLVSPMRPVVELARPNLAVHVAVLRLWACMDRRAMTALAISLLPGGCLVLAFLWMTRHRCPAGARLLRHDPMQRQRRDKDGEAIPHVLEWECRRCGRIVGETEMKPKWSLLARLYRQRGRRKAA